MLRPLLAVGIVSMLVGGGAQARTAADPIVGTWSRAGSGGGSSSGVIAIAASGGGFVGTVTVAYPSSNGCVHPVGQQVWEIGAPSNGKYAGTNHGYATAPPQCQGERQDTSWQLTSGTELVVCVGAFGCSTWTRPAPAVTSTTYRWRLAVVGRPLKGTLPRGAKGSSAGGSGRATFILTGTSARGTSASGSFRVTDRYAGRQGRLVFVVEQAKKVIRSSGTTTLVLGIRLTGSSYRNCAPSPGGPARRGTLTLFDGGDEAFDQLGFSICGTSRVYVGHARGSTVDVRVTP